MLLHKQIFPCMSSRQMHQKMSSGFTYCTESFSKLHLSLQSHWVTSNLDPNDGNKGQDGLPCVKFQDKGWRVWTLTCKVKKSIVRILKAFSMCKTQNCQWEA